MLRYRLREVNRTWFPRSEDMSAPLHALLIQRGVASAEEARRFLHPSIDQLHDPMRLSGMAEAVSRIRAAVAARESICVYGDYDVDGVSASSLLSSYLRAQGAQVEVYLPSRHTEGYGLNEAAIRAVAQRCRLLVTVDCGVTSVELIDLAKSLGMDCIVTDHHQPAEQLPDCPVVNPLLNDYPFPALCGAGVALKLVQALGGLQAAMEYVDIAALATVADVVSLTGENRVIVKLGLDRINKAPRPGLSALIEAAGLSEKAITAGNVAFQLAPRLNAGGRLGSARRSYDLLLAPTQAEAQPIAAELEAENRNRKDVEAQILAEAEQQLEDFDFPAHRALVLAGEGWNSGVIGLAASRLVEKYHYPTILLAEHDGVMTGSCRSIPGVDIHAALTAVQNHLVRYGGHKQAAGLTLNAENLDAFRADLDAYLFETIPPACYIPDQEYDMQIHFSELTTAFVTELEALQPTGFGNPAPVLRASAYPVSARAVGLDGAHLRLTLSESGVQKSGIFFRQGALADRLPQTVDALFSPKLNTFMGRTDVQLEMKAIASGDVLAEISSKIEAEEAMQHEFLTRMLYNKRINLFGSTPVREISEEALSEILAKSAQGTLILTADLAQTGRLAQALSDCAVDVCFGELPDDPRRFNAICAYPPAEIPQGWRRIVLAGVPDGVALPADAEVLRLENLRPKWLDDLPTVDEMREVYKSARRLLQRPAGMDDFSQMAYLLSAGCGVSGIGCAASVLALCDMNLVSLSLGEGEFRLKLSEMRKTDPESSAVWRAIQAWKQTPRNH